MKKLFSMFGIVGALSVGLTASDATAFSPSSIPQARSSVTLIAGGCGVGFHRGPYGGCVPNGYGYGAPVYRGGAIYRGGAYRGYRAGAYRGYRAGYRAGFRGGYRGGGRMGRRSDLRLKHDVALLGVMPNGLGFYRFVYNGGKTSFVGVMAQEVERVMPQAVFRGRDGYLRVDYDRIGVRFKTYDRWSAEGAQIPSASTPSL
jgi:hypothetical protein